MPLHYLKSHQAPSFVESDKCQTGIQYIIDEVCKQTVRAIHGLITSNHMRQTKLFILQRLCEALW